MQTHMVPNKVLITKFLSVDGFAANAATACDVPTLGGGAAQGLALYGDAQGHGGADHAGSKQLLNRWHLQSQMRNSGFVSFLFVCLRGRERER